MAILPGKAVDQRRHPDTPQETLMAEQPSYQYRVPKSVINVLSLEPGTRVRLVGDVLAEHDGRTP